MVTVTTARRWDFYGVDNDGKKCIFPRNPTNYEFAEMCDFRTNTLQKQADLDAQKYYAFPFSQKIGSSIVVCYSEGDSHGNSDRQLMKRSDDGGVTFGDSVVFFENSTGVFDFSLLTDLLADGEFTIFKVWTVLNTSGTLAATTNSTVSYGGLTYALWSKPKQFSDGNWYRTGYATSGSDIQSALFKSTDDMQTWAGVSVIFSGGGLLLSESDVEEYSTNNVVAFCREDNGSNNPIYRNYSTNLGVSWGTQSQMAVTDINGRQPHLRKLADGSIILGTGDRSGTSGLSSAGDVVNSEEFTGVTLWRSSDGFSTYSYRTPIARMFSTDGGQPFIEETTSGRIFVSYYATRSINDEPVIGSSTLNVSFMTAAASEPSPSMWTSSQYFTPSLYGGTTPGTPVLSAAYGLGYRIGKMCVVSGKMTWTDLGGAAGQMYIGNLPWNSNFDNDEGGVTPALVFCNIHYSSTGAGLRGYLQPDNNYIVLTAESGATSLNSATDASLTATGSIDFTAVYITEDLT